MAADLKQKPAEASQGSQNYKGFVAGVFSGVAKLSGKSVAFLSSPASVCWDISR